MDSPDEAEAQPMPLGLRLALTFLRIFSLVMLLPLLGSLLMVAMSLVGGMSGELSLLQAFGVSLASLGFLFASMVTTVGLIWFDGHLTRPWAVLEPQGTPQPPVHPARLILLPPLGCLVFYGAMTTILWFAWGLTNNGFRNVIWPLVWGLVGTGAGFLYFFLKKSLPR